MQHGKEERGGKMSGFEIVDNVDAVKALFDEKCNKALEEIGLAAEGYAKKNIQKKIITGATTPRTGRLMSSVTHIVDGKDCYIGTNVSYAIYFEMGSGTQSPYGRRKTPWKYQDANGNWHMTHGMRPRPFLKPAVTEYSSKYANIIKDMMEG